MSEYENSPEFQYANTLLTVEGWFKYNLPVIVTYFLIMIMTVSLWGFEIRIQTLFSTNYFVSSKVVQRHFVSDAGVAQVYFMWGAFYMQMLGFIVVILRINRLGKYSSIARLLDEFPRDGLFKYRNYDILVIFVFRT